MTTRIRYEIVRSILLAEWDPIGIQDEPAARDEYDSYARHVQGLLGGGASADEVEDYLMRTEAEMMGLVPDRERARRVAKILRDAG